MHTHQELQSSMQPSQRAPLTRRFGCHYDGEPNTLEFNCQQYGTRSDGQVWNL